MTFPQTGTTYQYDNSTARWRSSSTGRFVSNSTVVAEMRVHQTATFDALESLTQDLYAGRITVPQWQVSIAQELKDAHLAQAMYGAGGRANMTPAKWGRVGGNLANEYRFLTNFADEMLNGNVSEAQALARIRQYGIATQQSYWNEYADNNEFVRWTLNPGESCGDCVGLASGGIDGNGLYLSSDLPTVPGAGATQCRGNCNCTLERVGR